MRLKKLTTRNHATLYESLHLEGGLGVNELEMTEKQLAAALENLHSSGYMTEGVNYCPACGITFLGFFGKKGPTSSFLSRHRNTKKHQQALQRLEAVRDMAKRAGLLEDYLQSCTPNRYRQLPLHFPRCKKLYDAIKERWHLELSASESDTSREPRIL